MELKLSSMKTIYFIFLSTFIFSIHSFGQIDEFKKLSFEVEGKEIDYLDFGGKGEALIWVMDLHNYFNGSEEGKVWIEHLKELSKQFNVFVLIRPGYSQEVFDGDVFNVPKQSNFLKKFIDHLDVKNVFLYSKFPGNQDLIYLAENNPDKIKALIFQGGHLLYPKSEDNLVKDFLKNFYAGSCDLKGNVENIVTPRIKYSPEFIRVDKSIKVPLLILRLPGYDDRSLFLGWLENIESVSKYHFCGNTKAQDYFKKLANSTKDLQTIKESIESSDITQITIDKIKNTFGDYLTVKNLDLSKDIFDQSELIITQFKNEIN